MDGIRAESAKKDIPTENLCDQLDMLEEELFFDVDELDAFGIDVSDRYKARLKKDLTLADLTMKINDPTQTKSMYAKSDLHWVILIIVSVYYSLPTMQMVLKSNDDYKVTGNHDLCYYNQHCLKQPWLHCLRFAIQLLVYLMCPSYGRNHVKLLSHLSSNCHLTV